MKRILKAVCDITIVCERKGNTAVPGIKVEPVLTWEDQEDEQAATFYAYGNYRGLGRLHRQSNPRGYARGYRGYSSCGGGFYVDRNQIEKNGDKRDEKRE